LTKDGKYPLLYFILRYFSISPSPSDFILTGVSKPGESLHSRWSSPTQASPLALGLVFQKCYSTLELYLIVNPLSGARRVSYTVREIEIERERAKASTVSIYKSNSYFSGGNGRKCA